MNYIISLVCAIYSEDSSNMDRWKQLLELSLNEQASWQSYVAEIKPDVQLQPFDTIEGVCQGKYLILIVDGFCSS